jgi:LPXTG-site transpeptidase (sortase) family protein
MSMTNVLEGLRPLLTVAVSFAVVAAGFMPLEGAVSEELAVRRIVQEPVRLVQFTPGEMEIPTIGVRAPVVPVGTEADGTMASPTGAVDVGWWNGRRPGEGNALFAAHVNWNGRLGSFYRLKELKPGDEIVVRGDGKTVTYKVAWVRNFDPNMDAADILGNEAGDQIATLITCGGVFDTSIGHHTERVVARAVLST